MGRAVSRLGVDVMELVRDPFLASTIVAAVRDAQARGDWKGNNCVLSLHGFEVLPGSSFLFATENLRIPDIRFLRGSSTRETCAAQVKIGRAVEVMLCRAEKIAPDPAFLFRLQFLGLLERIVFPFMRALLAQTNLQSIVLRIEKNEDALIFRTQTETPLIPGNGWLLQSAEPESDGKNAVPIRKICQVLLLWLGMMGAGFSLAGAALWGGEHVGRGREAAHMLLSCVDLLDNVSIVKGDVPPARKLAALNSLIELEQWLEHGRLNALSFSSHDMASRIRSLAVSRLHLILSDLTGYESGNNIADPLSRATFLAHRARILSDLSGDDRERSFAGMRDLLSSVGKFKLRFLEVGWVRAATDSFLLEKRSHTALVMQATIDRRNQAMSDMASNMTIARLLPAVEKMPAEIFFQSADQSADERFNHQAAFFDRMGEIHKELALPQAEWLASGCPGVEVWPVWAFYEPSEHGAGVSAVCARVRAAQDQLLQYRLPSGLPLFRMNNAGEVTMDEGIVAALDLLEKFEKIFPVATAYQAPRDFNSLVGGDALPERAALIRFEEQLSTAKSWLAANETAIDAASGVPLKDHLKSLVGASVRNALLDATAMGATGGSLEQRLERLSILLPEIRMIDTHLSIMDSAASGDLEWFFVARAYRLLEEFEQEYGSEGDWRETLAGRSTLRAQVKTLLSFIHESDQRIDLSRFSGLYIHSRRSGRS